MKARTQLQAGQLGVGYPSRRDEAVLNCGGQRSASVLWDVSVDGGLVGDISFGRLLPAGAIVVGLLVDEQTPVVDATSVTLSAGSTALSGALDLTASSGVTAPALAGSAAGIKLASDSELKITIATTAASAGKVRFFVRYLLPNDL
jgi:hypothetical protein